MIEQLLDLALQQGADAAEVFQSRSHSRPVYFEANRLKQLESVESEGTSLRIWRNGQPGLAVAYGEIAPEDLVRRALSISQSAQSPRTPRFAVSLPHRQSGCRSPSLRRTTVELGPREY